MIVFIVDCSFTGRVIQSYEFGCPVPADGLPAIPNNADLIEQAKSNLTTERLAAPPYEGWSFAVRRHDR
ncbi:MAG TPA: hypothetical protein VGK90_11540 [Rhizomicrobium sp.]